MRLTDVSSGGEVDGPVPPAAALLLDVEIAAAAQFVRAGVLIQVVRSDGLVMFTGMSTLDGLDEVNLEPGDHLQARIAFSANVLRGTYIVNLHFVDTMRQWSPAVISNVSTFVVTETTRAAGCAELLPSYDIAVKRESTVSSSDGVPIR